MNKNGTIADITRWAETVLPGDEARARSVIVGCRKAGLFTKGGRGKSAPFMMVSDFPTAIFAVLHPGQVTQVGQAVERYWGLALTLAEIDDPERPQPVQFLPEQLDGHEEIRPYFSRFSLALEGRINAIACVSGLFVNYAPHCNFHGADQIELESVGEDVAIRVTLHGGNRATDQGWIGSGPDHSSLSLTFGNFRLFNRHAVRTTRTIYGEALNALSLMTPNLTKGGD